MRKITLYFLISFLTARALSPDHSKASQNDNWDKDKWNEIKTSDTYKTNKDKFNEIRFKPVETTKLRLEVNLKPGVSSGIHEWRFN